jgi:GNAT superfamily N-acetyltransferase
MNTQLPDSISNKSPSHSENTIKLVELLSGIGDICNLNITLKLIDKYKEQKKWDKLFSQSYDGTINHCDFNLIRLNAVFVVICEDKKEVGYMRLTKTSDEDVYCVNEAFVKPAYRRRGVFREALKLAIENHNVRALYLDIDRINLYVPYYKTLGFCGYQQAEDEDFAYLVHADLYQQLQIEDPLLKDELLVYDLYRALMT